MSLGRLWSVGVSAFSGGGVLTFAALAFVGVPAMAQQAGEEVVGGIAGIPEDSIATSLTRDLADPGGVRSRLAKHGIQFGVNYIGEVLGNPSAGIKQSTHYDGLLEVVQYRLSDARELY